MPQICSSFSDELFNEIQLKAYTDETTKSKVVVSLVEDALYKLAPLQAELSTVREQLGLALQNQSQMQNEIVPALKLLTPHQKRSLRERLFNR